MPSAQTKWYVKGDVRKLKVALHIELSIEVSFHHADLEDEMEVPLPDKGAKVPQKLS
jgi:hypothetical protein